VLERRQFAAPLAVIRRVGAGVIKMRIAAGDPAVDQHDDAGRAPAPAIGYLRFHRVETVFYARHGKCPSSGRRSSSLPAQPRNPEFWRIARAFCCPKRRRRSVAPIGATKFPNESRKIPEESNKLLTNGNIT